MAILFNTKVSRVILTSLVFSIIIVFQVQSETYIDKVNELIRNHKRILSAKDAIEAVKEQSSIAKKAWFPEFSTTAFYGYEKRNLAKGSVDTSMVPHQVDLTVTQPVFDFGAKSSALKIARLQLDQTKLVLEGTVQGVLLEAITAQVNLLSAIEIERYAKRSVSNIKQQAKLEDARVSIGSGFSTDVLQAKAQLSGAEARYALSQGARSSSENRYRSVFGSLPERNKKLEQLAIPVDWLPENIDDAVSRSLKNNSQVKALTFALDIARASIKQTRAVEFAPTVNLIIDTKYKHDVTGSAGSSIEGIIKGELKYSFNLGGASFNNLRAGKANYSASANRLLDARNLVEEQARNAYEQLKTTQRNAQFLRNQANISGEFLRLARKERQLGRRSLLDVLTGETVEINASSDATSAENQVIVASYGMLFVMGELKVENIKTMALK